MTIHYRLLTPADQSVCWEMLMHAAHETSLEAVQSLLVGADARYDRCQWLQIDEVDLCGGKSLPETSQQTPY